MRKLADVLSKPTDGVLMDKMKEGSWKKRGISTESQLKLITGKTRK